MARADEGSAPLWPWLVAGGGAATAVIVYRHHRARAGDAPTSAPANDNGGPANDNATAATPRAAARNAPEWTFPVPMWRGRRAEVSDGFSAEVVTGPRAHRKHLGADIMFRRQSRAELVTEYPPGSVDGSPGYFMPRGHVAVAAADGYVWSAGASPRGHQVVLSHGAPWATFYQHLEELFVFPTLRGASREWVRRGQPIGVIGGDPSPGRSRLRHLHFEIWFDGNGTAAVDPQPHLDRALHIPQPARPVRAAA